MKCKLIGCNKEARRKFCSNKHKDRYHNMHNPRGYCAPSTYKVLYGKSEGTGKFIDPLDIDEGPEGWDGHKDN